MMRKRNICAAFFLLFCLSGCDALYRLLDKEGAEEKELVGEVVPFESNQTIEEIQALLKLYGYSPGNVDGVLGLKTRNAIEAFQKDNGLEPSRFADQETWAKLNLFKENGLVVNGELNIQLVQQLLKTAGFNPGTIDGKIGRKTTEAVKSFQQSKQLKIDGKIGYNTLAALAQYMPQTPPPQPAE